MNTAPHIPVMLEEVLTTLNPLDDEVYVDGTFGAGGYTRAILKKANCKVIAIDRDPSAAKAAEKLKEEFKDRFLFIRGNFGNIKELLTENNHNLVNGFVLDLGVSSMQLDKADRGFSFRFDGPLDMRMDTQSDQKSAAEIVNSLEEQELANILYKYGEEKRSRRIAKAITSRRTERTFDTTKDLADLIRDILPTNYKDKSDPATRSFQALRIAVNDELGELEHALEASKSILKENGRLVVVTFHSLEDRIVKDFLKLESGMAPSGSRHAPELNKASTSFKLTTKKALQATDLEIQNNSRSRSAKLRAATRVGIAQ